MLRIRIVDSCFGLLSCGSRVKILVSDHAAETDHCFIVPQSLIYGCECEIGFKGRYQ